MKINFKIYNNDSILNYYNIQLEKYNFIENKYINYSKDVFSDYDSPQELTITINPKMYKNFEFFIQKPNWIFVKKNRNKYINNINVNNEIELAKKGIFRLKVYYGSDEYKKSNFMYSDDIILK